MRLVAILILIVATALARAAPPDPGITARWNTAISATITWHQAARGCLYRNQTFIGCYERAGRYAIVLGGPQTDGNFRPMPADVFVLQTQGQSYRASLRGRDVYLPVMRR